MSVSREIAVMLTGLSWELARAISSIMRNAYRARVESLTALV